LDDIQIEPKELKQKMEQGANMIVVDVREPWEHQICNIAGAKLVPLNTLPGSVGELAQAAEVVVYCHHGIRSLNAAAWLRAQGVESARSLTGGIERWANEIDPKVAKY
jgi:rhodanese-related sulfurtransferase